MVAAVASWNDSLTDQAGTLGVIYSHCRAGGETRRAGLRPETPGPACAVLSAAETGILFPGTATGEPSDPVSSPWVFLREHLEVEQDCGLRVESAGSSWLRAYQKGSQQASGLSPHTAELAACVQEAVSTSRGTPDRNTLFVQSS